MSLDLKVIELKIDENIFKKVKNFIKLPIMELIEEILSRVPSRETDF